MKKLYPCDARQAAQAIVRGWQCTYGAKNLRKIYLATRKEVLQILNTQKEKDFKEKLTP